MPVWRVVLKRRVRRGKEDPIRYVEKLGQISTPRPDGKVIWVHALSVGESLALLTVLRRLGEKLPDAHFVLTTVTKASVVALENVKLPPRVIHQYLPVDTKAPVQKFLNHWRPNLVAFAELDLWPYMLHEVKRRNVPLMLINGRISNRTFEKLRKRKKSAHSILQLFDVLLAHDKQTAERMVELGVNANGVKVSGSLKLTSDLLPDNQKRREHFFSIIDNVPLWLAASTNVQEEQQLFEAHKIASQKYPNLLLIIAPRQMDQVKETYKLAKQYFEKTVLLTDEIPPDAETKVYIANSFGEMGVWYRVANFAFIGNSMPGLDPKGVGQNPCEALALGAMVTHGPAVENFSALYEELLKAGATLEVSTSAELAAAILRSINDSEWRNSHTTAGKTVLQSGEAALTITCEQIANRLR